MALKKQFNQWGHEFVDAYWQIKDLHLDFLNKSGHFSVLIWPKEGIRSQFGIDKAAQPLPMGRNFLISDTREVTDNIKVTPWTGIFDDGDPRDKLYTYLKTLAAFSGSKDV